MSLRRILLSLLAACVCLAASHLAIAAEPATCGSGKLDSAAVKPGTWYKRTPLPDAPKNPRMGYEGAIAYDPFDKVMLRWGGHNQGGGEEQNSEMWVYDVLNNTWKLMEPNFCPPGSCCNRDNVFDIANRRYVRFPSFSASHGWQWRREVYQNQSSAWAYDLPSNTWRNMRPWPQIDPGPLRGAAYDTDNDVTVVAQGEGAKYGTAVYDLYTNTWTPLNAKNEPPARNTFGMAYDPVGRKFVTFGSQSGSDPRTWVFDLRKNEWQALDLNPHPPEKQNGAVMAYDPLHKIMLCVAMTWTRGMNPEDKEEGTIPNTLETWAFDPAKLTWTKLDPPSVPEATGVRNRMMLFDPDLNVFVLEDRTGNWHLPDGAKHPQELQEWIFRYAYYTPPKDLDAPPAAPTELKAEARTVSLRDDPAVTNPVVRLTWKPSVSADVSGYAVYRGVGQRPWLVDYARVYKFAAATSEFLDGSVKPDAVYYYVAAISKDGKEGPPSIKVRTQPRALDDLVVSALDAKKLQVAWVKAGDDIAGYNVYRAPCRAYSTDQVPAIRDKHPLKSSIEEPFLGIWKVGEFKKITDKLVAGESFVDTTIDLGKPTDIATTQPERNVDPKGKPYKFGLYAYRVTSVNALGVESGPSPYFLTVPGPVSDLKSRERKGETDLKWTANREAGIAGYRVYRMESRGTQANGFTAAITLLTPELVKGCTFTDKIGNDDAKRYYVVAVDALGQEGIVGSPTWGNRDYAKYYEGFLEEWHQ